MNLFHFNRLAKESIMIKSPVGSGDAEIQSVIITPLFEALANTTASCSVGSVAAMGHEFSATIPHKQSGDFYKSLTIKTPGTDFYLPESLGQFKDVLHQVIDAQYRGNASAPHLRTGQEYCTMEVSQLAPHKHSGTCELGREHFDISAQSIDQRALEIKDRYIVSDITELTTPFFHANLNVTEEALNEWGLQQSRSIRNSGVRPRQYAAYEIAHFDSTTAHGIILGPKARTKVSFTFSAQPSRQDEFSTVDLKSAHKKMCSLRREFA